MNSSIPADVVLVEDSDDDAFFFLRALEDVSLPHSYVRFRDGQEFIRFLEAHPNESFLVFLDWQMPHINGREVLQWVQGRPVKDRLEVIVLSGSDLPGDIRAAAALDAADYVLKPISAKTLSSKIGAWSHKKNK